MRRAINFALWLTLFALCAGTLARADGFMGSPGRVGGVGSTGGSGGGSPGGGFAILTEDNSPLATEGASIIVTENAP